MIKANNKKGVWTECSAFALRNRLVPPADTRRSFLALGNAAETWVNRAQAAALRQACELYILQISYER